MITGLGRSFKGRLDNIGPYWPFSGPAPLNESGIMLGMCPQTGRLMFFDPPRLMQKRLINGMVFQIIAPRDHGKSTLMKSLGIRALGVQAGMQDGMPLRMKVEVNDRKPEGREGKGEYAPYAKFVCARTEAIAELPSINIFHLHPQMMMQRQHIHELAIRVCELAAGQRLGAFERFVLLVGVNKMYERYRQIIAPDTLEFVLHTLTTEDLTHYYSQRDAELLKTHADTLAANQDLKNELLAVMERHYLRDGDPRRVKRNVDEDKFLRAAGNLGTYVGSIQQGEFGGVIGGKSSLYEILSSPRVVWDWTGVTAKARSVLEFMRQIVQEIALKNPALDIIPHVRLGDEERSAGNDEIHLRHRLEYVEKARAFSTMDFISVQFEKGLSTTLGAEGSIERGIADLINAGTGARFFGKQPYDETLLHELSKYGISDHNLFQMTQMDQGDWLVQTGGSREAQWLRHCLVSSELPLVQSNSAAYSMANRARLSELTQTELGYSPPVINRETIARKVKGEDVGHIEPQE